MSDAIIDLPSKRSLTLQSLYRLSVFRGLIAQLLIALIITSCAFGPGRGSPTVPAPPSFPAMTPIMPRRESSPTPEASLTVPLTVQPSPETDSGTIHTVQAGDTLLGLAKLYDVPMAAIQLENDMGESTVVQRGQTLAIPDPEAWEGSSPFWIVREVEQNETLIGIANAYDLELDRLQAVNGLDDADQIAAGQQLILPLSGPAPAPTPVPTDRPQPTATSYPTATASPEATATTTSTASALPTYAAAAVPPPSLASWPHEIAQLINEVRAQHSLPPFTYNATLEEAAQAHANDCAQRGWCSHTGSDGTNSKARIQRAGYDASGWAECWAQTQTPQKAVEVWMDETPPNDPHRRTLLSDWLTEIGLGVSEADWGTYIIANFGRP